MRLDISTLIFAGALMSLASGIFLLMHWWYARKDRAARSWGIASCGRGVGILLLAMEGHIPDFLPTIVGPIILTIGAAEFWAAARIFRRGSVNRRPMIITAGIFIAAAMVSSGVGQAWLALTLNLAGGAAFHAAAAAEFWLVRVERPRGRRPMIFLLSLQGTALFLAAINTSISGEFSVEPLLNWFGVIHFVGFVFAGGATISLIMMLKDRSESMLKTAALVDPLTGLANRRAITAFMEHIFERWGSVGAPISVLAFDLDKFKNINDMFGHATGDQVLRVFADVLSSAGGKNHMAARMGGEEFVLALTDCSIEKALDLAGRIRVAFQDNARFINGHSVNATVSIGVATAPDHGSGITDILSSADSALYRAKTLGRNRVVLSVDNPGGAPPPVVTRIA